MKAGACSYCHSVLRRGLEIDTLFLCMKRAYSAAVVVYRSITFLHSLWSVYNCWTNTVNASQMYGHLCTQ